MTKGKKTNKTKNNPNPKTPTKPPTNPPINPPDNEHNSSGSNNNRQPENEGTKTKNHFFKWATLIVNVALAISTGLVFYLTIGQSKSAEKSANAAISAVELNQKQFKIDNAPYLIVGQSDSIIFSVDKPFAFYCGIINLGHHLVNVTGAVTNFYFEPKWQADSAIVDTVKFTLSTLKPDKRGPSGYVYDKPTPFKFKFDSVIISDETVKAFNKGTHNMIFGMNIFYENLPDGDSYKFTYIGKIITVKPPLVSVMITDNQLVKSK
ncbi:MAG: hypothetical protein ABI663_17800 [Chryseolinea sp.]